MASFKFATPVFPEGTAFVFGLWVRISDGAGDFRRHLVNDTKLEAPAADQHSQLDKFIDELDELLLPDLAKKIEKMSVSNTTSTRAANYPKSIQPRFVGPRNRPLFGLRNSATIYQETAKSGFLSALEEDLDSLLQLGKTETTACREVSNFPSTDPDSDTDEGPSPGWLVITVTPEGRFVHWKDVKPDQLRESRTIAHLEPLPYQEGRPLEAIFEGSTELVDPSFDELEDRHILMNVVSWLRTDASSL
jgi:hypothetical protein